MRQLLTRSLSGLVYIAIILLGVFTPPLGTFILSVAIGLAAIIEWNHFNKNQFLSANALSAALIFIIALIGSSYYPAHSNTIYLLLIILLIALALQRAFSLKDLGSGSVFQNFFGLIYIGTSVALLNRFSIFNGENQPWLLAGLFILIWSSDSFAYLSGKYLGKHKLAPTISPNKTWEGFIGGAVCTLSIAIILQYKIGIMPIWTWLCLALLVIIFGSLGDLFESAIKRSLHLKDSGKFIPGHGGILDRIDSLLFALPVTYFFLRYIEKLV